MKKLIATIMIIFSLLLTGCGVETATVSFGESRTGRFTYEQHIFDGFSYALIITDNYSGEQYLYVSSGNSGGLTRMEF